MSKSDTTSEGPPAPPETGDQHPYQGEGSNREAAKYRIRPWKTESERDALAGRVTTYQRARLNGWLARS